jgi:hypothetical protein
LLTIFLLKTFLTYMPLKKVWADRPTAVRFRVKGALSGDLDWLQVAWMCRFVFREVPPGV